MPSRLKKRSARKIKPHGLKLKFKTPALLESALTHPSYRYEHNVKHLENFDRMEFFGDSILNFVICRKIYKLFPDADEGALSKLRSILVSKKILSRIAREIGLLPQIKIGRSLKDQKDFIRGKICTDAFESLIAAIYFDRGFDFAEKFILKHFKGYFDAKRLFRLDPNPKSTLQELVQNHWHKLPLYTSEQTEKGFKTLISVSPSRKASALAKNRKDSEEKAARLLLRKLRQEWVGRSNKKSSDKK